MVVHSKLSWVGIDIILNLYSFVLRLTLLVHIGDAYGCKRPVSVPGITVNVKRVKVREDPYAPSSRC